MQHTLRYSILILGLFISYTIIGQDFEKLARKEAKAYTKKGYYVAAGAIPMELMLAQAYKMELEKDINGNPKYFVGNAEAMSESKIAAEDQAIEVAKQQIAGLISTEIIAQVQQKIGNGQLNATEAEGVVQTIKKSQAFIGQNLTNMIVSFRAFKEAPDGKHYYAAVRVAYKQEAAEDVLIQSMKQISAQDAEFIEKLH